jgi:hypothetical protein
MRKNGDRPGRPGGSCRLRRGRPGARTPQAVVNNKEVRGGAPLDCSTAAGGGGGSSAPWPQSAPAGRRLLRGPWAALQGGWPVHMGAPPLKRPHHALHNLHRTKVMAAA